MASSGVYNFRGSSGGSFAVNPDYAPRSRETVNSFFMGIVTKRDSRFVVENGVSLVPAKVQNPVGYWYAHPQTTADGTPITKWYYYEQGDGIYGALRCGFDVLPGASFWAVRKGTPREEVSMFISDNRDADRSGKPSHPGFNWKSDRAPPNKNRRNNTRGYQSESGVSESEQSAGEWDAPPQNRPKKPNTKARFVPGSDGFLTRKRMPTGQQGRPAPQSAAESETDYESELSFGATTQGAGPGRMSYAQVASGTSDEEQTRPPSRMGSRTRPGSRAESPEDCCDYVTKNQLEQAMAMLQAKLKQSPQKQRTKSGKKRRGKKIPDSQQTDVSTDGQTSEDEGPSVVKEKPPKPVHKRVLSKNQLPATIYGRQPVSCADQELWSLTKPIVPSEHYIRMFGNFAINNLSDEHVDVVLTVEYSLDSTVDIARLVQYFGHREQSVDLTTGWQSVYDTAASECKAQAEIDESLENQEEPPAVVSEQSPSGVALETPGETDDSSWGESTPQTDLSLPAGLQITAPSATPLATTGLPKRQVRVADPLATSASQKAVLERQLEANKARAEKEKKEKDKAKKDKKAQERKIREQQELEERNRTLASSVAVEEEPPTVVTAAPEVAVDTEPEPSAALPETVPEVAGASAVPTAAPTIPSSGFGVVAGTTASAWSSATPAKPSASAKLSQLTDEEGI